MRLFPARPIRMEARPVTPIRMEGCNLIYKSEMRFLPLPPIRMEGCDLIYKSEMRVMPAPPIRMEGCDLIYHEVPSYSTNQKWGCCLFYQSEWRLCPIPPISMEALSYSTNQKGGSCLFHQSESSEAIWSTNTKEGKRLSVLHWWTNQIEAVTCSTNQNTGFISYSIINTNHSEGKNLIIRSENNNLLCIMPTIVKVTIWSSNQ